jgi:hypothetical protein
MSARRLRHFAAAALACACACNAPNYGSGHLQCAPSGRMCPDNFYCSSVDNHCWKLGDGPDGGGTGGDGGAGGPSLCTGKNVLLCDGFEAASIDAQWSVDMADGSITLDPTVHFRGAQSLHLHTNAAGVGANPGVIIFEGRTFPITGTAWVRAWMRLKGPFPTVFDQVINFLDTGMGGASYAMKDHFPIANDYTSTQYSQSSMPLIVDDTWMCLRVALPQSGATDTTMRIFFGDAEVMDADIASATVSTMRGVNLGLDFYGNGAAVGATDAWIDEVIVDNKPIQCSD